MTSGRDLFSVGGTASFLFLSVAADEAANAPKVAGSEPFNLRISKFIFLFSKNKLFSTKYILTFNFLCIIIKVMETQKGE